MNQLEAMLIYCTLNRKSSKVVRQIMNWNEGGTIKENAKSLGISAPGALHLAKRYRLVFRKAGQSKPLPHPQLQEIK